MSISGLVKAVLIGIGTVVVLYIVDMYKAQNDEAREKARFRYEQANEIASFIQTNPTKTNLEKFRRDYPNHPFAGNALELLDSIYRQEREDALWSSIEMEPTELKLLEFTKDYSDSKRISKAKDLLREVRYKELNSNLSPDNLDKYLSNYPDKEQQKSLCRKLDSLYWAHAVAEATEYFYSRYLHSFTGTCTCKNKRTAIENIQRLKKEGRLSPDQLKGQVFSGIISQNGLIETLIIQFSNNSSQSKLEASYNIGNVRVRNLSVKILGNEFSLEKDFDGKTERYLQGYFYPEDGNSEPFVETIYSPDNLYWRADLYKN